MRRQQRNTAAQQRDRAEWTRRAQQRRVRRAAAWTLCISTCSPSSALHPPHPLPFGVDLHAAVQLRIKSQSSPERGWAGLSRSGRNGLTHSAFTRRPLVAREGRRRDSGAAQPRHLPLPPLISRLSDCIRLPSPPLLVVCSGLEEPLLCSAAALPPSLVSVARASLSSSHPSPPWRRQRPLRPSPPPAPFDDSGVAPSPPPPPRCPLHSASASAFSSLFSSSSPLAASRPR